MYVQSCFFVSYQIRLGPVIKIWLYDFKVVIESDLIRDSLEARFSSSFSFILFHSLSSNESDLQINLKNYTYANVSLVGFFHLIKFFKKMFICFI